MAHQDPCIFIHMTNIEALHLPNSSTAVVKAIISPVIPFLPFSMDTAMGRIQNNAPRGIGKPRPTQDTVRLCHQVIPTKKRTCSIYYPQYTIRAPSHKIDPPFTNFADILQQTQHISKTASPKPPAFEPKQTAFPIPRTKPFFPPLLPPSKSSYTAPHSPPNHDIHVQTYIHTYRKTDRPPPTSSSPTETFTLCKQRRKDLERGLECISYAAWRVRVGICLDIRHDSYRSFVPLFGVV